MKMRCRNCGQVFDESAIKLIDRSTEDYLGMPCFEEVEVSPCCDADFEPIREEEENSWMYLIMKSTQRMPPK